MYYRWYISRFADIAAPLHALTRKGASFAWNPECSETFDTLKDSLVCAPVLGYRFGADAVHFQLQTDASAVGLRAVLEQEGHVIAYTSRTLTEPERHYSVIQRECLAVVYALKQFRHYLLGCSFLLITDHAPLQWLSAQKMEGMLCRWDLAMQEYDFQIVYLKGTLNANTDALSRYNRSDTHSCAVTSVMPHTARDELRHTQQTDSHLATSLHPIPASSHGSRMAEAALAASLNGQMQFLCEIRQRIE